MLFTRNEKNKRKKTWRCTEWGQRRRENEREVLHREHQGLSSDFQDRMFSLS